MRILFVHQGFPGQYIHIIRALAQQGGHRLVGLGIQEAAEQLPPGVEYYRYGLNRPNQLGLHPWVQDFETKVLRADPCARAANELKQHGFTPDLICGHPGWGELLFLRDVWPNVPLLTYQEFFYNPRGFDYDFDPELQGSPDWESCASIRIKTANQLLNLAASDWCITPTSFQQSSFPKAWRKQISVIHDGIDTNKASPVDKPSAITLPGNQVLSPCEKIVTFVNRNLEPYRGCHTMIRSIPHLQRLVPNVKIVMIGETSGVSYGVESPEGDWKDVFLKEIQGNYDPSSVHFVGQVSHDQFINILQLSQAHVYLTYPFVLSWSLLEAMSCGCAIVGSATDPVMEVVQHRKNGLLVDFFSPNSLAESVSELLHNRLLAKRLGLAARETVLNKYQISDCVQRQLALMDFVASGTLSAI